MSIAGQRRAAGFAPVAPSARRPTLGSYLRLTRNHSRATLSTFVADPRGRRFAALLFGTVAALYASVEWFLYLQHCDPVPPPFLRIPTDQYYG